MIKSHIEDGLGSGEQVQVKDNSLVVTQYTCPPLIPQKNKIFRQYMTVDGLTSGSNDMGIDGSVTAVKFWVPADDEVDRYITTVSFRVTYGSAAEVWEWADIAGVLTNGFRFYYERPGEEIDIHDAVVKNEDLLRLGVKDILPKEWEVSNLGVNADAGYMVSVSLNEFMPPYGIKLDMGSNQRLVFEVRDDNTDADTMNAMCLGFDRFE